MSNIKRLIIAACILLCVVQRYGFLTGIRKDKNAYLSQNNLTSSFQPFYSGDYSLNRKIFSGGTLDEYIDKGRMKINSGTYRFNSRSYPCFPLGKFKYQDNQGLVCLSNWAGNPYDIWVSFESYDETSFSKPYLTGKKLSDIFKSESIENIFSDSNLPYYYDHNYFEIYFSIKSADCEVVDNELLITIRYLEKARHGSGSERSNDSNQGINKYHEQEIRIDLEAIIEDGDNDGLTDIMETRFGLNKENEDTDGDGIKDIYDSNPLFSVDDDCNVVESEIYSKLIKYIIANAKTKSQVVVVKYDADNNCTMFSDSKNKNLILNSKNEHFSSNIYISLKEIIYRGTDKAEVEPGDPGEFSDKPKWTTYKKSRKYMLEKTNGAWKVIDDICNASDYECEKNLRQHLNGLREDMKLKNEELRIRGEQ